MQAVAELDDDHADVLGHGDDHLANRLRLSGVPVLELVELGDAIDEQGDLVAEVAAQSFQGVVGILHGVVQQGGGEGLRGHPELGQDGRHRDRVSDVRLAGLAPLTGMRLLRHLVGAHDETRIGLGMIGAQGPHEGLDGRRRRMPP